MPVLSPVGLMWPRAALTLAFAAFLILGAFAKLLDSRAFAGMLENWHVLPPSFLSTVAVLFALLECQAGLGMLVGGRRRRWGVTFMVGAYVFYVVAAASALLRGHHVPVEGVAATLFPMALSWGALLRDTVVLVLAAALRRGLERRAADRGAVAPVRWAARR